MTAADFSRVNDQSINAKQQLLDRLDELEIGASESDRFNIAQQRADIQTDMDLEKMIQARLAAAAVVVTPLDPTELAQLNTRAKLVNDAIVSNSIVNADLTLVTQLAAAAKGIGSILQGHTS